jgi:ABC-2 type transport system ATP-binding protein
MDEKRRNVLEVSNLSKSYGDRRALDGVSFAIQPGEIFGLLGPNGAGKTTTISVIATILRPSGGEVQVAGHSATDELGAVRNKVGLVPQQVCLYPTLTAEENLRFFGEMYGLSGHTLATRVEAMLTLVGLVPRRRDRVDTFSGGMQRRLNLGCGLIHQPELLLLDEPTVGLDPQSRERIFSAVEELASAGIAVLYTTHYMEEAERLCHRVAIMDEGHFVAEGAPRDLAANVGEGRTLAITFERSPGAELQARLAKEGAGDGLPAGPYRFQLAGPSLEELIPELVRLAAAEQNPVKELVVHQPNLGEVFLHLTGKALRD